MGDEIKLTRHLFTWSPEARYADFYERAFFNSIIGTMNPADGMTAFYVPLESGYWILRIGDPSVEVRDVEVVAGSPGDWMRAVGDSALAFRITRQRRTLSMIPLNRLFGQRYAVYWRVRQA